jgi:hypothetical protein
MFKKTIALVFLFMFTTTGYQTSTVTGPGGSAVITTPTQNYHHVPGGNVPTAYAAVRFDVLDAKTNKAVISRIEDRTRVNATIFDNSKPKDIYKRITGSFFGFLDDKVKDSK